jgi:serine/threonine-protein kinase
MLLIVMKRVRYIDILQEINAGGTATVYLGVNLNTGFQVAVKEPQSYLYKNPHFKSLFKLEANHYLELDHPNIVKLEDLILDQDEGYLVMEYVEGRNLREYIKEITGPLPFHNAALFLNEVLNAIAYTHNCGYVHMDIKPANIMISNQDEIKVIDFGISLDTKKKFNAEIMGTPYYMSPEQINGTNIDNRSDIYSLGVTLFELVTGKPPFAGADVSRDELLEFVKTVSLPSVSPKNEHEKPMTGLINHIIQKATAKNPDDRYQNCEEFQEDLMQIID